MVRRGTRLRPHKEVIRRAPEPRPVAAARRRGLPVACVTVARAECPWVTPGAPAAGEPGRSGRQVVPPAAGPWCGSRERLRPAPAGRRRSAPQLPAVAPRRLPPPADGSRETWSGLRREAIAPTGLGPPVVPSIGRPSAVRAGSSSGSRLPSSRLWRSRRARPRPRLPAPEPAGSCRWRGSDVEAKVSDVAVLHHVLLALQSQKTLVASRGQGLFA